MQNLSVKKREKEELANAKTDKNRAKRQKRKERSKMKSVGTADTEAHRETTGASVDTPIKKRRLVNGKELVFKRPGERSDDGSEGEEQIADIPPETDLPLGTPPVLEPSRITIVEED